MKKLRQIHLYLGCLFAPLIIYFSLSGAWQVFRLNDLPEGGEISVSRTLMHEISKPHTHSTFPGKDPKKQESTLFNWMALLMGLGMIATSVLGIILALRFSQKPILVIAILGAGIFLPILFLLAT